MTTYRKGLLKKCREKKDRLLQRLEEVNRSIDLNIGKECLIDIIRERNNLGIDINTEEYKIMQLRYGLPLLGVGFDEVSLPIKTNKRIEI